jgi:rubredoxin
MPSQQTRSETCPKCAVAKTFTAIYVKIRTSQTPGDDCTQQGTLWRCPTCKIVVDFSDIGQGT